MRVAVLSDIHSNAHALDAVLDAIGPCEQLWVLGDTVGYGPYPDRVVARLEAAGAIAVQGNHDAAALGRIPTATFNALARAAVEWTSTSMSAATRAWLADQPDRREVEGFTLVHGSPRDPLWEYVLSIPTARLNLAAFSTRHCLVGHTHIPATFRDEDGHIRLVPARDGAQLRLDERRCILNPGSVGQPRDGDPRASVMLIDTRSGVVEWRRIDYPVAEAQRAMRELPLPRPLAERLALGR